MTRINVGIMPNELTGPHLLAEHREIKRIPNCIKSGRFNMKGIPSEFTLGTGHVKFFYNKIAFLRDRYKTIYVECVKRGYNVTDYSESFENISNSFMGNYEPTVRDRDLLLQRIHERLTQSKLKRN
tara:strand:+ start:2163 stop:2540 length:378 start_codon:yes stop_codon:yes gene_type:complete